jgi:nitrite reductase/ring-hydroxylating ferredoxin subunit
VPHRRPRRADRITHAIERASFLDAIADRIAAVVPDSVRTGRARDLASGTPIGHAVHPAIVAVPMGAWASAGLLDIVGGRAARRSARRLVGFGLLTAAPTAVTGWSDWLDTGGAERRVGLVHAVTNATAIGCYAGSWSARGRGRHARGVALALLGSGVLSVGGWLGGHLTYALGVGVDTTAFQHMDAEWADIGTASEVAAVGARLHGAAGETPVLVVRLETGLVALADRCTHRGGPLHDGRLQNDCIVCPWHHSIFDLSTGVVVRGPATRPQPSFEARIVGERVQVRRPAEARALRSNPV